MPGNFHTVPESVLATWPKPNYVDPVRRSWLPALACTLLGVSTVLIAGRFYLRARKQAGDFGLDDLFIFLGWFTSIGFAATAVINSTQYGLDRHTWDVPITEYVGAAMVGWIAQVVFLVSTSATKVSVLLFYRRMVKDTYSKRWLYAIWFALATTAAFFIAILLIYCFICRPLSAYWQAYSFTYEKDFTCLDGNVLTPVSGVLSIVSDVYAVVLPCLVLRHYDLDVPQRQKVGLNIIFGLGLIVAGCGVARTYYLWEINHTYDTSWTGYNLFVWSLLECHLAVIFACAPSLRAFFRRYLGGTLNRSFRAASKNKTKDSTHASTLRNSHVPSVLSDPEAGKEGTLVNQTIVAKSSDDTIEAQSKGTGSRKSFGSETAAQIKSAEDYEAYNMRQLSKHGYKKSKSTTSTHYTAHDWSNSRRKHDVDNALSWLDDRSS